MNKTIDNFKLSEVLTDCEIIEDDPASGDSLQYKEKVITEGALLFVYDSGQAALELPGNVLDFLFTDEVAQLFDNLTEVSAYEMIEVLSKNGI